MCGRFALAEFPTILAEAFGLTAPRPPPRYNIAPTQYAAAVLRDPENRAVAAADLFWGLVPFWAKNTTFAARSINARAETADAKPTFRAAFRHRRCLIPASGFYEWRRDGKAKTPFYFSPAEADAALVFAGLWEDWNDGVEHLRSFAILTTEANALMRPIHDRMPVILRPDAWNAWLDPAIHSRKQLADLLRPCDDGLLRRWRVDSRVNNARHDDPSCVTPV